MSWVLGAVNYVYKRKVSKKPNDKALYEEQQHEECGAPVYIFVFLFLFAILVCRLVVSLVLCKVMEMAAKGKFQPLFGS